MALPFEQKIPESQNLLGRKQQSPEMDQALLRVNDAITRLRILEERFLNLREKSQLTEENMLKSNKKMFGEFKSINEDLALVKREVNDVKEKISLVIAEMRNYASKQDFRVLQKYIELWQPIQFVTREEVAKIVDDALEDQLAKKQG